ncbi:MAG: hypothetical protein L0956_02225 [Candidatus Mariimomonas ferrooxydans]
MDFFDIGRSINGFLAGNLYISIAVAVLLLFLLFKKPKLFFTIFILALLMAGVFYVISTVSSTGVSHKQKMIEKGPLF